MISQFGHGWDAKTMTYGDLFEMGILDPAKVTINAIENSASVAGLVLTTECLVTEIPVRMSEDDMARQFDAEGMGAGMGLPGKFTFHLFKVKVNFLRFHLTMLNYFVSQVDTNKINEISI